MLCEITEHAIARPGHPAFGVAGGEYRSYAEVDDRSAALADALYYRGVRPGDVLALVLGNVVEWAEVAWAGLRSGLLVAALNHHLRPHELGELLVTAEPTAVVVSAECADLVDAALNGRDISLLRVAVGGGSGEDLETLLVNTPAIAHHEARPGARITYTSGTTGIPKAIREPFPEGELAPIRLAPLMSRLGIGADSVVLSPAPCYHSAPFGFATTTQRLGGTALTMSRFDVRSCAAAVTQDEVTHLHLVPTMLYRLLRAPDVTAQLTTGALEAIVLGGAPCAPELKAEAQDRLGAIVHEYYGASEGYGQTHVSPAEALARPGTVGRAVGGGLHITDRDGRELSPGEVGRVWFSGTAPVTYAGDRERTAAARDPRGWSTVGDLGYLDEEEFLFLVGRESQVVISGGVNIHPQEVEHALQSHPAVCDAAVFGVPDPEWGESLVALVVPNELNADEVLLDQLRAHCQARLARAKCPREMRLALGIPRSPAGKVLVAEARTTFLSGVVA